MGVPALSTLQYVLQAVAHQQLPEGLLDVFLNLFDGHDLVPLYWATGRRPGFYRGGGISRTLLFEAHLLGAVLAGSYPFRGVRARCGCEKGRHVCDGAGTRYLCIDLDAKNGETDIEARTRRLIGVCWRAGLYPVVFSSRSGRGAHVYVFLGAAVTTREANVAARALAQAAGIRDRCDIIPSGEHYKGFGTLHALPCSPMAEPGGGVMFDGSLRPIADTSVMVASLRWADSNRSPAITIQAIAAGRHVLSEAEAQSRIVVVSQPILADRTKTPTAKDYILFNAIRKRHPQFKRALAVSGKAWRGGRSVRDIYLAGYLRRQGMTPAGIVHALVTLPNTKSAERGEDYAWLIAGRVTTYVSDSKLILAGQALPARIAKTMRQRTPHAPWDTRQPPPETYSTAQNPWWTEEVQTRLKADQSKKDSIVLAYLIDRYYRGPFQRRMYYASQRELGAALGYQSRTVNNVVRRLSTRFSDILKVVPGVSHPTLRLAHGFYVPEKGHNDRVDWYLGVGRLGLGLLPCGGDSQHLDSRDSCVRITQSVCCDEYPF